MVKWLFGGSGSLRRPLALLQFVGMPLSNQQVAADYLKNPDFGRVQTCLD